MARAPGFERPYTSVFRRVGSLFGEGLHLISYFRGTADDARPGDDDRFGAALVDVHERRLVWASDPDVELVDVTDEVRARWAR